MSLFAPLFPVDSYLPLDDYGLVGHGTAAALVDRDGAIPWPCVPRFDSPPVCCGLLDAVRGRAYTMAPVDLVESRQGTTGMPGSASPAVHDHLYLSPPVAQAFMGFPSEGLHRSPRAPAPGAPRP